MLPTPLGAMEALFVDDALVRLQFTQEKHVPSRTNPIPRSMQSLADLLRAELHAYFSGTLRQFSVPLRLQGTRFQRKAWQALHTIPYGHTISYSDQASRCATTKAVRAVAQANAANAVSIIIPCHRVIAKSGDKAGYAGGRWRKEWLLEHEKKLFMERNEDRE